MSPRIVSTRTEALSRARRAVAAMEARGFQVLVTGSLARGDFGAFSDVDFLVTRCPPDWRYRIESVVEDEMRGIPFDVIYFDELTPGRLSLMRRDAKPIQDLAA
jgi:predicted nucleotidyltransferase